MLPYLFTRIPYRVSIHRPRTSRGPSRIADIPMDGGSLAVATRPGPVTPEGGQTWNWFAGTGSP